MPPPAGWQPHSPVSAVLDTVYWCNRVWPVQIGGKWPLGVACRPPVAGEPSPRAALPPASVRAAVATLCAPTVYELGLPFITADPAVCSPAGPRVPTVGNIAVVDCAPAASIPVCTVADDNKMLVWDDDDHPCASGRDCVAAHLANAPGPLPFWVPPGKTRSTYAQPAFCLLCIRTDAAALVAVYRRILSSAATDLGRVAVTLPPFQNLVRCPGGYRESALGVRPDHFLFAPVSIAGSSFPMDVVVDPLTGKTRVDQTAAVWTPNPPCL